MHVVIILALASELFALFDALPFNSVSGMLSYPLQKFWPQYKATLSVWTFLCVAAILLAWGYGPMTSQAGLEKQVKVLKVQIHELELDQVQKSSKIVLLEHEIGELERHRERLVTDVIAYTRRHSLSGNPAATLSSR